MSNKFSDNLTPDSVEFSGKKNATHLMDMVSGMITSISGKKEQPRTIQGLDMAMIPACSVVGTTALLTLKNNR
jgi:hypothetical protein